MKNRPALIFDIGSSTIRCGVASADEPRHRIPSVVVYPQQNKLSSSSFATSAAAVDQPDTLTIFCGAEAVKMKAVGETIHPFVDGLIARQLPDAVARQLIGHCADVLHANGHGIIHGSETAPIVVCEPLGAPKGYREEIASCFFEDLGAQSILFISQALCGLFAVGELSGIVLDTGKSSTRCVAAVDGIGLPTTIATTSRAGDAVTEQLIASLRASGQSHAVEFANTLKSECRCAEDTDELESIVMQQQASAASSSGSAASSSFMLPDGQIVKMTQKERTLCTELLWSDSTTPREPLSITQVVEECLLACDEILRSHLMSRLHVFGGAVSLPKFEQRMLHELRRERNHVPEIDTASRSLFAIPPASSGASSAATGGKKRDPALRTWTGAAIFSSLTSAQMLFTTREDYEENGAATLARYRQFAG